jgi:hypothetical protein
VSEGHGGGGVIFWFVFEGDGLEGLFGGVLKVTWEGVHEKGAVVGSFQLKLGRSAPSMGDM